MTSLSRRQTFKLHPIPLMLTAALAALGGTAYAADDGSMSTQTAEKISITGSNVRRTDSETPSPVQIITSQELKNSGYTTVAQVLQSITANGQGTLSQGFPQAFASGASGISLHGLNTSATLVLIDGHRMAPYPLSDDGQRSFVDISNIPFDAVERIEVLKDGASAIYGSDAMAGVVNIILRKSFVGTTATGEMGTTTEGGGKTSHASVIHGWGDLDSDGYNAYLSAEYRHQDNITYGQRSGHLWSSTDLSSIGGQNHTPGAVTPDNPQPPTGNGQVYLTDPTLNYSDPNSNYFFPGKCSYALQQANGCQFQNTHLEIEPRTQNVNLLGSFTKKLEGGWTLGLKASLFDSQAEQYTPYAGTVFPQSFSPLVSVAAGRNPTIVGTSIPQITIPANYPGNALGVPAIVNGVIPGSPLSHTEVESKATRIAADLSGSIGAWDIDSSAGYTAVSTTQTVYGTVNVPALNAALNRPVNPFSITGGNTAADMAAIFPTTSASDNSYLEFVELHASRSLMKLPGGDLGVSTGVSYTDRTMTPLPRI